MKFVHSAGDGIVFRQTFYNPAEVQGENGVIVACNVARGISPLGATGRVTYVGTESLLINRTQMTIRARFRTGANPAINTDIVAKISGAYTDNQFLVYFISSVGPKIALLVASSAADVANVSFCSGTPIVGNTDYTWHGVYDGSLAAGSRVTHYINGALSAATILGTIPVNMRAAGIPVTIFNPNGGNTRAPDLTLYDTFIWERALSAAEVASDAADRTCGALVP